MAVLELVNDTSTHHSLVVSTCNLILHFAVKIQVIGKLEVNTTT